MHGEQNESTAPREPQDARAEWVTPALTDLGSFEDLTRNGLAGAVDAEGMS